MILNRRFSKDTQMTCKHVRYSTSLIIRKIKIKTIMRLYCTPTRMAIKKQNKTKNNCWRGCGKIGALICWCSSLLLWENVWWFFKKLNIKLPYDPAILCLSRYPKDVKTVTQTDAWMWMFTAALFTIAKRRNKTS